MEIIYILILIVVYILALTLGINTIITQEFTFKSGATVTGNVAIFIGLAFIAVCSYGTFTILWKVIRGMREVKDDKEKTKT